MRSSQALPAKRESTVGGLPMVVDGEDQSLALQELMDKIDRQTDEIRTLQHSVQHLGQMLLQLYISNRQSS